MQTETVRVAVKDLKTGQVVRLDGYHDCTDLSIVMVVDIDDDTFYAIDKYSSVDVFHGDADGKVNVIGVINVDAELSSIQNKLKPFN